MVKNNNPADWRGMSSADKILDLIDFIFLMRRQVATHIYANKVGLMAICREESI